MYALHLYLNISENVEFAQRVYELPESCFDSLLYEGRLRFQHHSIAVKPLSVPSTLHTPSQTSHFAADMKPRSWLHAHLSRHAICKVFCNLM